MTKRHIITLAALLVLVSGIALVWAANQDFRASLLEVVPASDPDPGTVYARYYVPGFGTALAVGSGAQGTAGCGTFLDEGGNQRFCTSTYRAKKGGYEGFVDNLFNYGNAPDGTRAYSDFSFQQNGGTASHIGFYAWDSDLVNVGGVSQWFSCTGTVDPIDCAGTPVAADATGSDQTDVPGGPIAPLGSLKPIPVPRVTGTTPTSSAATINLAWDAATESGGSGSTASYIIWYAIDDASDNACNAPTDAQLTNQLNATPIAGTTAAVDVANDLSVAVGSENCVTFALQIEYINLGTNASGAVRSRFKSANSQSVYLGSGGLAADIVNLRAQALGASREGLSVQVSWDTQLEDGVQGFYVARSGTADGQFVRVSDLIPANNEPSSYDFLDVVERRELRGSQGVFYRIETLDIDDNVSLAGPVTVSLPSGTDAAAPGKLRRR